jgi:hypothetical protein
MAYTRFHDDECRITKQNQQMTDPGRWVLDTPGNGSTPCFILDPQIIPQKWGANVWTNCTDLQSSLLNLNKPLNRDCISYNKDARVLTSSSPITYPVCTQAITDQPRATMPAWTLRGAEQNNWDPLLFDPQNISHTEMQFRNNKSTRISEKDNFKRTFNCTPEDTQLYTVMSGHSRPTYIGGPTVCRSDCQKIPSST